MRRLDPIEREYKLAMDRTMDPDALLELSIGLQQYRAMFKPSRTEYRDDDQPD